LSFWAHCALDTWLWLNRTNILYSALQRRTESPNLTTFAQSLRPPVTGQSGHVFSAKKNASSWHKINQHGARQEPSCINHARALVATAPPPLSPPGSPSPRIPVEGGGPRHDPQRLPVSQWRKFRFGILSVAIVVLGHVPVPLLCVIVANVTVTRFIANKRAHAQQLL